MSIWARLNHVLLDTLPKRWENFGQGQGSRKCVDNAKSKTARCVVLDVFRFGHRGVMGIEPWRIAGAGFVD